jgi:hypothetical protein
MKTPGQLSVKINSLRVIEAAAGAEANPTAPASQSVSAPGTATPGQRRSMTHINRSAIVAAKAVPENKRTGVLFENLLAIREVA